MLSRAEPDDHHRPAKTSSLTAARLSAHGYAVMPPLLDASECALITKHLPDLGHARGGSRCLLDQAWCAALAIRLGLVEEIAALLPANAVAVQCIYFEKSQGRNWLVPMHQDLSIPVAERLDAAGLRGWSVKEGTCYVQAPAAVLGNIVAIRLHLDDCGLNQGPLRVVPGSHGHGHLSEAAAIALRDDIGEQACAVAAGGVMAMRPLLLHASSKSVAPGHRRVLHFLFGPALLPMGLRWSSARSLQPPS